jgi:katanin p60 ATPase-containing subunit A1
MVLAATNHPWDLDDALRRRFEKRVYIPLPNKKGRRKMFEINLKDVEVDKNVNFDELVKITEGYSGADIANVCREAALMNMRRKIMNVNKDGNFDIMKMIEDVKFQKDIDAPITEKDLIVAVKNISKSVSKNDLKRYEEWTKEFASK